MEVGSVELELERFTSESVDHHSILLRSSHPFASLSRLLFLSKPFTFLQPTYTVSSHFPRFHFTGTHILFYWWSSVCWTSQGTSFLSRMIHLWTVGAGSSSKAGLIMLLQICRFIHSVEGINCYYCAWIDSTEGYELPSLRGRKDICRPQNFDPAIVHKETCRNGCITMILHEAETVVGNVSVKNCSSLERTLYSFVLTKTGAAGGEPGPATRADVDQFPPLPITFFYRGCPNNHTTKLTNGCEFVKFRSGCQQRTCYCTTELCNGEIKSTASDGSRRWSSQKAILIVFRMVFIVTMR